MIRTNRAVQPFTEDTAELLSQKAPRAARALRDRLPSVIESVVGVIRHSRLERARPAPARPELIRRLQRLHDSVAAAAGDLEALAEQPLLQSLLLGTEGIFRGLDDISQLVEKLRTVATFARAWEARMRGSGRQTVADLADRPAPELLVATAVVRLFRELGLVPAIRNEHSYAVCESLWRASGAPASKNVARWKHFLAKARGQKPSRPKVLALAQLVIDGCLVDPTTNALAEAALVLQDSKTH